MLKPYSGMTSCKKLKIMSRETRDEEKMDTNCVCIRMNTREGMGEITPRRNEDRSRR